MLAYVGFFLYLCSQIYTMGKYINIGNTDFASVRKDEYVDKSQLIAYVNHVLDTQLINITRSSVNSGQVKALPTSFLSPIAI